MRPRDKAKDAQNSKYRRPIAHNTTPSPTASRHQLPPPFFGHCAVRPSLSRHVTNVVKGLAPRLYPQRAHPTPTPTRAFLPRGLLERCPAESSR